MRKTEQPHEDRSAWVSNACTQVPLHCMWLWENSGRGGFGPELEATFSEK